LSYRGIYLITNHQIPTSKQSSITKFQ